MATFSAATAVIIDGLFNWHGDNLQPVASIEGILWVAAFLLPLFSVIPIGEHNWALRYLAGAYIVTYGVGIVLGYAVLFVARLIAAW